MSDPLLLETAERVFRDTCTPEQIERAEREGTASGVWSALEEIGFPGLGVPESAGGAGGSLEDALAVLRIAGRHAAPVPLAESGLLAGWLLAGAGLEVTPGPASVAAPHRGALTLAGERLWGSARRVPWGRAVQRIAALIEVEGRWWVAVVAPAAARIEAHANLAGEPRDTLHFAGAALEALAPAAPGVDGEALFARGALTRVALMAGALESACELTVQYTRERRQFGKPVAEFQAVQAHLVSAAQESALVAAAAAGAERAAAAGAAAFEIAAAKLLANRAARRATRAVHQAHGAMGMTREYPLHPRSRRLWAWRKEYGDELFWSRRLGSMLAAGGADGLYPAITGGSEALRR